MNSVWSESVENKKSRPNFQGEMNTDVLIVGGGMAGILIAYRLKKAGVSCVVLEAKTIGSGVTKNTTAKITSQHGLIYSDIIKRFGIEKARAYFETNSQALLDFEKLSEKYKCDFEKKDSFVYTLENNLNFENEIRAYEKLKIPILKHNENPLPIKIKSILGMENQAQFNALKFLVALADKLEIYENSFVHRIEGNTAFLRKGKIKAKQIVIATHYPLVNVPGLYFMKLYQHRSYVIALENAVKLNGYYVDENENGFSFRNYQDYLLIGGGDHKTGKKGGGFSEIRKLTKTAYPDAAEKFHWATQDCMSLDKIPYIGRHNSSNNRLFVATGFNKWGMTSSMVAAGIISDLITKGSSDFEELYSPQRSMFTTQLFKNLGSAASGLLSMGTPRCSHLGCKLKWNKLEKTWDCPCHGSRFDKTGHIIDNPAKRKARI